MVISCFNVLFHTKPQLRQNSFFLCSWLIIIWTRHCHTAWYLIRLWSNFIQLPQICFLDLWQISQFKCKLKKGKKLKFRSGESTRSNSYYIMRVPLASWTIFPNKCDLSAFYQMGSADRGRSIYNWKRANRDKGKKKESRRKGWRADWVPSGFIPEERDLFQHIWNKTTCTVN